MLIVNKTNLSYQCLGNVIDQLIEMGDGNTFYYGKIEHTTFEIGKNREIQVEIHYLKKYTKFIFWERDKNEIRNKIGDK